MLLGLRALRTFVLRLSHPLAVRPVRYAGRPVGDEVVIGVVLFFMAYFGIALIAAAVVASGGYDLTTSATAALTAIGNVGPGLGEVGPMVNWAHLPAVAKWTMSMLMLLGRLELLSVLILVTPWAWKK